MAPGIREITGQSLPSLCERGEAKRASQYKQSQCVREKLHQNIPLIKCLEQCDLQQEKTNPSVKEDMSAIYMRRQDALVAFR